MKNIIDIISKGEGLAVEFKIIPLTEQVTEQAKRRHKIIAFCRTPRSSSDIMEHLELKHSEYFRSKILRPLLAEGILTQTMPDTPRSPKQKYYSTGTDESGDPDENEDKQILRNPIFAFTDDFFMQARGEEYDRVVIKKEQEQLYFEKNYGEVWKQLTCHHLHDLGAGDWHELSNKLVQLHAGAFAWHPSAQTISDITTAAAKATGGQEARLKIKALVERLDLVQQESVLRLRAHAKSN